MKDKAYIGLSAGLLSPFAVILLFYLFRFNYLSVEEFIHQSILLKVHFKIISIGVFFADLGLFYLFLRLNKNNAAKGVILAVFIYFSFFWYSNRPERKFPVPAFMLIPASLLRSRHLPHPAPRPFVLFFPSHRYFSATY